MAVTRMPRTSSGPIAGNEILGYLRSHPEIREVCCHERFTEEDVNEMETILRDYHTAIHLNRLELPRNNLTASAGPALNRAIQLQIDTLLHLDLSQNPLTANVIASLCETLSFSDNAVIQHLNLSGTQMGPRGASAIHNLISRNRTIQVLNISNNAIGTRGMRTLVPSLTTNPIIQSLDISCNRIGSKGASLFATALDKATREARGDQEWTFHTLNIASNGIGPTGMRAFGNLLALDKKVQRFFVEGNNIQAVGAFYMHSVLRYNHTLREIRMGNNNIGDEGAGFIAQCLTENKESAIECLSLDYNRISSESSKCIADALSTNPSLEYLNLSGNQFDSDTIRALAESLPFNLTLEEIDLSENQIETEGAYALTMILARPSNLKKVHWDGNPIQQSGIDSLERVPRIQRNYKFWLGSLLKDIEKSNAVNLNLTQRVIGDEEVLLITGAMSKKQPLVRSFYLEGQKITARSLKPFASNVLRSSECRILRLYIRNAQIGDEGVQAVANALSLNTSLEVLCLSNCNMTSQGAKALARGIPYSKSLRRVTVDRNPIGDKGFAYIVKAIGANNDPDSSITALSASNCALSDKVMGLSNLERLTELHLCNNEISDLGALALCTHLTKLDSHKLTWLSLRGTELTERGAAALRGWLGRNSMIDYG